MIGGGGGGGGGAHCDQNITTQNVPQFLRIEGQTGVFFLWPEQNIC